MDTYITFECENIANASNIYELLPENWQPITSMLILIIVMSVADVM